VIENLKAWYQALPREQQVVVAVIVLVVAVALLRAIF